MQSLILWVPKVAREKGQQGRGEGSFFFGILICEDAVSRGSHYELGRKANFEERVMKANCDALGMFRIRHEIVPSPTEQVLCQLSVIENGSTFQILSDSCPKSIQLASPQCKAHSFKQINDCVN
jgi:hypothetical protein